MRGPLDADERRRRRNIVALAAAAARTKELGGDPTLMGRCRVVRLDAEHRPVGNVIDVDAVLVTFLR